MWEIWHSCSYLPTDIEMITWLPVTMKSVLEWWKIPFMPWAGVLHIGPSWPALATIRQIRLTCSSWDSTSHYNQANMLQQTMQMHHPSITVMYICLFITDDCITLLAQMRITYVALEFTNQKNGMCGELVGRSCSGHPVLCPAMAFINEISHLRQHRVPPHTPLYQYHHTCWCKIDTTTLTWHLCQSTTAMGQGYGISPDEISVQSLWASEAMNLLCAWVDMDMIRIMGHWRSNKMLRYIHVQSFPLVAPLVSQMLCHRCSTMMPNLPV